MKVFTQLFPKQIMLTGTITISDKGVRTHPSALKEPLREPTDKLFSSQMDLMNFILRDK